MDLELRKSSIEFVKGKKNLVGGAWAVIFAVGTLAGCGKSPEANSGPLLVEITANDQMKYNVTEIEAKAGQPIRLTLRNTGSMPKIAMGHNFVLVDNQIDLAKFVAESQLRQADDYIAPDFRPHILAATRLLGPGESQTIEFQAPAQPGFYSYLCTFPAHHASGMKGVLSVK